MKIRTTFKINGARCALASVAACFAALWTQNLGFAQTTLSGDHIIVGDLNVGTSGTAGNIIVSGSSSLIGSVGIGTSDPQSRLFVQDGKIIIDSTSSIWGQIQIGNPTYGGEASIAFFNHDSAIEYDEIYPVADTKWVAGVNPYGIGEQTFGITSASLGPTPPFAITYEGNVGIGTASPATTLDVNGDVLVRGSLRVTGTAAFSDLASATGDYAVAFSGGSASGDYSTAVGEGYAGGEHSFASGVGTAAGQFAAAFGMSSASGIGAAAFGESTASGFNSVAFGTSNIASGAESAVFGSYTTASGLSSAAFGYSTNASGESSAAFGVDTLASGDQATAFGTSSIASGYGALACGFSSTASGTGSVAFGEYTSAIGWNSLAHGYETSATGGVAFALGYQTSATGGSSVALGHQTSATGGSSVAFGYQTSAIGGLSIAGGNTTIANAFSAVAIGQNNVRFSTASVSAWEPEDPLLQVGNGLGYGFSPEYSDALRILKSGKTTLRHIGFDSEDPLDGDLDSANDNERVALVVEGHTKLKGKVVMPRQGDILMGEFGEEE